MSYNNINDTLSNIYNEIYKGEDQDILEQFVEELIQFKEYNPVTPHEEGWYKDAIVYSVYVDLFNDTFKGLINKLDYLSDLGVTCLWLLPVLDSPMRDAGFDIRNYKSLRKSLLGLPEKAEEMEAERLFGQFIDAAHEKNMKVIFDVALNHVSDQHKWFTEAVKGKDNPFRNYFIWNDDSNKYQDARLLFKGMCPSNWEKTNDQYFFHRFFEFQPDLNYRNPKVLIEMTQVLLYWISQNVDGFRADAIPYLWKEEGTDCENLPQTHSIVKFLKAVIEFVKPNTLLLAEACQKPTEVVKYIGKGDECNAGYHFPLMPMIYKSLAIENREPIINTLSTNVTPAISPNSQWFTFLRCHDELSLELVYVSEEDRKLIHDSFCHKNQWNFRLGEGISARLAELMDRNPDKIALAYSIMLTLPGTPIIYYGDEFAKLNDEKYYQEQIKFTGKDDTRFLVRGKVDWNQVDQDLSNPETLGYKVYKSLSKMLEVRKKFHAFGRGDLEWIDIKDEKGTIIPEILAYARVYDDDHKVIIQNLSAKSLEIPTSEIMVCAGEFDRLGQKLQKNNLSIILKPYSYLWV